MTMKRHSQGLRERKRVHVCVPAEIIEITKFYVKCEVFSKTGKQRLSSLFCSPCPSSSCSVQQCPPPTPPNPTAASCKQNRWDKTPPWAALPYMEFSWTPFSPSLHTSVSFFLIRNSCSLINNKPFLPNNRFYFNKAFLETYALIQGCNLTDRHFPKRGTSVWQTFWSVSSFQLCNSL